MASRALLLLTLLLISYAADSFASVSSNGRSLLQRGDNNEEDEEEAKREAEALEAYAEEQRERDEERTAIIENAQEEAEDEVIKFYEASDEEEQIEVFVNLWRDAKGPTILIVLTTLVNSTDSPTAGFTEIVAESMLEAERRGFSFQISDALWAALTIVENEEDGEPLLDAISFNLAALDEEEEGSGCTYVKNLFTDAEVLAIENGYETEFTKAFDDPEYLNLAECFYDACDDDALDCCGDVDAELSGRCGCKKKEPNVCDFNLFLNTPRPIWRCNGEECDSIKCLCPDPDDVKKSKRRGKGRRRNKSKEDEDSTR